MSTGRTLEEAIARVVTAGNCSGCGACAALFPQVAMELSVDGYMRPVVTGGIASDDGTESAPEFAQVCPGASVRRYQEAGRSEHQLLGPFVSAWEGSAIDGDLRYLGSSGGVLSALTGWLVETGQVPSVLGAARSAGSPTRTVPVRIMTRAEAEAAAGSRYAPVAVLAEYDLSRPPGAVTAKPCEINALRAMTRLGVGGGEPLMLSFFCAGTPSQLATHELIEQLGGIPGAASKVDYRGEGWPGDFRVVDRDGTVRTMNYEESWGKHLGRQVQQRCKICVDGTGGDADIAVGDFWQADDQGFPLFDDAEGTSVVIARTQRGYKVLQAAAAAGIIRLGPISLDAVASIQPLQTSRRQVLAGRLAGRMLAGKEIPRYSGFSLLKLAMRTPLRSVRAMAGSWVRAIRRPRLEGMRR